MTNNTTVPVLCSKQHLFWGLSYYLVLEYNTTRTNILLFTSKNKQKDL